ncbi:hypothetical protein GCM10027174_19200 [Salinifilum aidingensis]
MTERSERMWRAEDGPRGEAAGPAGGADDVLPAAPALLSAADGAVLRATGELAGLAGVPSADDLVGRNLSRLLSEDGPVSWLHGERRRVPVRVVSWPRPGNAGERISVLADVSDLAVHPPDEDSTADARELSGVGRWMYDPQAGEIHPSPMVAELLGSDSSRPKFDVLLEVTHPADRGKAEEFYTRLLNATEGVLIEVELRDLAGERVYLCTGRVECGPDGWIERVQGTVQDITEHRVLKRQLHDERRKLEDAERIARLGTWEWDPRSDVIRLSDTLHALLGRPPKTHTTFSGYLERVHAEDRERVREAWMPLLQRHETVEVEHRYFCGVTGKILVLRLRGSAVRDADGRTLLVGTAQDVTEQRAAATRLERSSQRFTDLVSVTPVGIGLFDTGGRLVDVNEALCDLFGFRAELLQGRSMDELVHPDEPARELPVPAEAEGRLRVPQRAFRRSDGEAVDCELHVSWSVQDDGSQFWLVVFQDITERRRATEALHYQATHDELTGLPNRAAVKAMLSGLLPATTGGELPDIAVLFCDIDKFKRINDGLGHDAGDELLVALARRLERGLPEGCVAARISGDEYVVICRDLTAVGGLDALATRVSRLLRTAVPVHGQLIRVSASIGAVTPRGAAESGAAGSLGAALLGQDLLRFADAAMFEAKSRGVGKVSLASPALMASADRQLQLEGQLREALHNDGLSLVYQPVVATDGRVLGAEALVRWPHPERGMLAPDTFLPVAEQGDLLQELDRWVLRTALREAASWPGSGGSPVSISVNLGGMVPGAPDFVRSVTEIVAETGIQWNRVVLEVVETALVDLPAHPRQEMADLSARGVRFAVDDFGTGYSSLARLKDLPAQIIKVDRRFVSGVGGDASDFAVTRAVVDMARAMGRRCIAEGVEHATQFHVLSGVGVDAYQGWLFSYPLPAARFRELLERSPLSTP